MTTTYEALRVIDADTHLTEPHDLWTRERPGGAARSRPPGT